MDESTNGTRSLLSEYYGAAFGGGGNEEGDDAPQDIDAAQMANQTLTEGFDVEQDDDDSGDVLDLNSRSFDSEQYATGLLKRLNMQQLITHDNKMTQARRSLDQELQMLVYHNYTKFLSASDMVRTLRVNVEGMKGEMEELKANIESITKSTHAIETSLDPNRSKLNNLTSVARLLGRLEFLFELPSRMTKYIEMGAREQAVKYYAKASVILQRYAHVKSFNKIRIESQHTAHCLQLTLRNEVRDAATSTDDALEAASLLLQLGSPVEHLLHDLLKARKEALLKVLRQCVEEEARQQQQQREQEAKAANKGSAGDSSDDSGSSGQAEKDTSNPFADFGGEDSGGGDDGRGNPFAAQQEIGGEAPEEALEGAGAEGEGVACDEEEGEEERETAAVRLIKQLRTRFFPVFSLLASSFHARLVAPYRRLSQARRAKLGKQQQQQQQQQGSPTVDASLCEDALADLTKEIFQEVFLVVRNELLSLARSPQLFAKVGRDGSNPGVEAVKLALSTFYYSLAGICRLVPLAKLEKRAEQLIERALRAVEEALAGAVQDGMVTLLRNAIAYVAQSTPTASAATAAAEDAIRQVREGGKADGKTGKPSNPFAETEALPPAPTAVVSGGGAAEGGSGDGGSGEFALMAGSVAKGCSRLCEASLHTLQTMLLPKEYIDGCALDLRSLAPSHASALADSLLTMLESALWEQRCLAAASRANAPAAHSTSSASSMGSSTQQQQSLVALFEGMQAQKDGEDGKGGGEGSALLLLSHIAKRWADDHAQRLARAGRRAAGRPATGEEEVGGSVCEGFRGAAEALLQAQLDTRGFVLCGLVRAAIANCYLGASSASLGSPPAALRPALRALCRFERQLAGLYGHALQKIAAGSPSNDRKGTAVGSLFASSLSSGDALAAIDKVFDQQVTVHGSVGDSFGDVLLGLLRIVAKAMVEEVRSLPGLNTKQYRSLLCEGYCLEQLAASLVPPGTRGVGDVSRLARDIKASARDRLEEEADEAGIEQEAQDVWEACKAVVRKERGF